MKIYLTSSHTLGWAGDLNTANGLADSLRRDLQQPIHCVMVSSFPDDVEITDRMAWETRECFDRAGLPFARFEVIDRRTQPLAGRILRRANFIIICGGHVPTENDFLNELYLRNFMSRFDGVLLTISAGSMNCAAHVYAPPEYDGEAADPNYQTYYTGLGLTDINILPHYQQLNRARLAGRRLVHEIVAADSHRHPVYCLPDGTYFYITPDGTELRGRAYKMLNGNLRLICRDDERRRLSPAGRWEKIDPPIASR